MWINLLIIISKYIFILDLNVDLNLIDNCNLCEPVLIFTFSLPS